MEFQTLRAYLFDYALMPLEIREYIIVPLESVVLVKTNASSSGLRLVYKTTSEFVPIRELTEYIPAITAVVFDFTIPNTLEITLSHIQIYEYFAKKICQHRRFPPN